MYNFFLNSTSPYTTQLAWKKTKQSAEVQNWSWGILQKTCYYLLIKIIVCIKLILAVFSQVQTKLYLLIVTPTGNSPLTLNPGLLEADFQTINTGSPFHILISTDTLSLVRLKALQTLNQGKQRSVPFRIITYDPACKQTSSLRAHCLVLVQI